MTFQIYERHPDILVIHLPFFQPVVCAEEMCAFKVLVTIKYASLYCRGVMSLVSSHPISHHRELGFV